MGVRWVALYEHCLACWAAQKCLSLGWQMVIEKSCCYPISTKSSKNNVIALLIYKIELTPVPCEHPLAIMVEGRSCGFDEEKNRETGEMHIKNFLRIEHNSN